MGESFQDYFKIFAEDQWRKDNSWRHCGGLGCILAQDENLQYVSHSEGRPFEQNELAITMRNDCTESTCCLDEERCTDYTGGQITSKHPYSFGSFTFSLQIAEESNDYVWTCFDNFDYIKSDDTISQRDFPLSLQPDEVVEYCKEICLKQYDDCIGFWYQMHPTVHVCSWQRTWGAMEKHQRKGGLACALKRALKGMKKPKSGNNNGDNGTEDQEPDVDTADDHSTTTSQLFTTEMLQTTDEVIHTTSETVQATESIEGDDDQEEVPNLEEDNEPTQAENSATEGQDSMEPTISQDTAKPEDSDTTAESEVFVRKRIVMPPGELGLSVTSRGRVGALKPGGRAEQYGLRLNCRIISVNGKPFSYEELRRFREGGEAYEIEYQCLNPAGSSESHAGSSSASTPSHDSTNEEGISTTAASGIATGEAISSGSYVPTESEVSQDTATSAHTITTAHPETDGDKETIGGSQSGASHDSTVSQDIATTAESEVIRKRITIPPGPLGVLVFPDGRIAGVHPDGVAKKLGLRMGYRFVTLNGLPFTYHKLFHMILGKKEYEIEYEFVNQTGSSSSDDMATTVESGITTGEEASGGSRDIGIATTIESESLGDKTDNDASHGHVSMEPTISQSTSILPIKSSTDESESGGLKRIRISPGSLGLSVTTNGRIAGIQSGGYAERLGLRIGYRILRLNGQPFTYHKLFHYIEGKQEYEIEYEILGQPETDGSQDDMVWKTQVIFPNSLSTTESEIIGGKDGGGSSDDDLPKTTASLHTTIAGENDYFESVPELYQDDTPPPLEPDTKDEGEAESEESDFDEAPEIEYLSALGWYRVLNRTRLRTGESTISNIVTVLSVGQYVRVVQIIGRRARIDWPRPGWISLSTEDGENIVGRGIALDDDFTLPSLEPLPSERDYGLGWYVIVIQTRVRKKKSMNSDEMAVLAAGLFVRIVQIVGRRARIDWPMPGWVSLYTDDGRLIMKETDPNSFDKDKDDEPLTTTAENTTEAAYTLPMLSSTPDPIDKKAGARFCIALMAAGAMRRILMCIPSLNTGKVGLEVRSGKNIFQKAVDLPIDVAKNIVRLTVEWFPDHLIWRANGRKIAELRDGYNSVSVPKKPLHIKLFVAPFKPVGRASKKFVEHSMHVFKAGYKKLKPKPKNADKTELFVIGEQSSHHHFVILGLIITAAIGLAILFSLYKRKPSAGFDKPLLDEDFGVQSCQVLISDETE